MTDATVVHLLRHGQVRNPAGVLYGRLPDYHLSDEGRVMAKAVAASLAGRDVAAVVSSPLERARETAAPVAAQFGLEVQVDERLIEPWNRFEGLKFGFVAAVLHPATWPSLRNPFRPSWGEPYDSVVARITAAMADAAARARGREAVCVTHQLPIWVTRQWGEGRRLWHLPALRQCGLASLTSFTYEGDTITGVTYSEPAARADAGPM
jgi:broad specificity phosphatase PhoE